MSTLILSHNNLTTLANTNFVPLSKVKKIEKEKEKKANNNKKDLIKIEFELTFYVNDINIW